MPVSLNDRIRLRRYLAWRSRVQVACPSRLRNMNFGIGYDSGFQKDSRVSPALPTRISAWRFGVGLRSQPPRGFGWGAGLAYGYLGTLEVAEESAVPGASVDARVT